MSKQSPYRPPHTLAVHFALTDSPIARHTRQEVERYAERLFGARVHSVSDPRQADLILGMPSRSTWIARTVRAGRPALPSGPHAAQGYGIARVGTAMVVASNGEHGVRNGLYALLEHYGARFQINGEILPARRKFTPRPVRETRAPAMRYRGLLPWDNFLCGMSGWNLEDYQVVIDRMLRMRLNMLQFHFYPGMAYFTETVDGNTAPPLYVGMPVDRFDTRNAVGRQAFRGEAVFAPRPWVEHADTPREAAEAVQEMFRQALDYARMLGIHTVVGFELMESTASGFTRTDKPQDNGQGLNLIDPLNPDNVRRNRQRLESLMRMYPHSDTWWMWQSEARGWLSANVGREPGAAGMRQERRHWAGNPHLTGDIDYAEMFLRVVQELDPAVRKRIATGGWSIEHLFPTFHSDAPPEAVFASLNSYEPRVALADQIDSFRTGNMGRRTWMIEWWEFDGNQWFPQFRAGWQEPMYKRALQHGVEAITLLGWKLTGVEHNIRYLAEWSWQPSLSAQAFYAAYARDVLGSASLAPVLWELDRLEPITPGATPGDARHMLLGAGWMSLVIPPLPTALSGIQKPEWRRVVEAAAGELCGIQAQTQLREGDLRRITRLRRALNAGSSTQRERLSTLIRRLEFRVAYLDAVIAVNQSLIAFDNAAREGALTHGRRAAAPHARHALSRGIRAVELYAAWILDRGDQGVVAQLNEQFIRPLRDHLAACSESGALFAIVDLMAFRLRPMLDLGPGAATPWRNRDGAASCRLIEEAGQVLFDVRIEADGSPYHSLWIRQGDIDLDSCPWMDMEIQTTTDQQLALLFQAGPGDSWYALNLVGRTALYGSVDQLTDISTGDWRRVCWDLQRAVHERLGADIRSIRNLILGCWSTPSHPIAVRFRRLQLGTRNLLD